MRRSSEANLRWPNGPWPGGKTPYFTAKTGHMARHGIWPSDPAHLPPNADRPSSVIGGAKMLLSHNRYEMRRSSAATSDGQSGPWPGEKTPYFKAKTGHMA